MQTMKNLKFNLFLFICSLAFFSACQEEDQTFGEVIIPSNLNIEFEVQGQDAANPFGDGSGFVTFKAVADNAITYQFNFGDNSSTVTASSGEAKHRFTSTGVNTYAVTVSASGNGGLKTSKAISVEVFSAFDDPEAKNFLSGGVNSSKIWYLAASRPAHLGVGPTLPLDIQINGQATQYYFPAFFGTTPFEKCNDAISDCLCDDELTFTQDANSQLTYQLNNNGQTFFNAAHQQGVLGQEAGEDACFDFNTAGVNNVSLSPTTEEWTLIADWSQVPDFGGNPPRGTLLNFSNDAFMGYYVGSSTYEIMFIDNDYLYVRTIDALDSNLAWYHKFSTTNPNGVTSNCDSETGNTASGNNDVLVWEEDFNYTGAPCDDNWSYDFGDGCAINLCGWGNNESQYYTNRSENIKVEDGVLKITAIKEDFSGSAYTSARIKSMNKFEFTYGRVEIRAKLAQGAGTWPAIWMLGDTSNAPSWPAIGEIDIVEHVGNNQNTIFSSLHYPGNSGGNANTNSTVVSNVSNEFKIYELSWTPTEISFKADGVTFHTISNNSSLPFDHEFYFILNIAMGGNFGGNIDPNFTQSTMEIDYIRVYQ
jgi:beta-glucanase (GH16 family)